MNNQKEQLDAINDIKKLMERSSKFSALSGLSGIIVGIMALVCIGISYTILGITPLEPISYLSILNRDGAIDTELLKLLIINFSVVLLA